MLGKVVHFRNRKSRNVYSHTTYYFPDNMKQLNSKPSLRAPLRQKKILQQTPDILADLTIDTRSALPNRLHDRVDILPSITAISLNDDLTDSEPLPQISNKIQQLPHMNQMVSFRSKRQDCECMLNKCISCMLTHISSFI